MARLRWIALLIFGVSSMASARDRSRAARGEARAGAEPRQRHLAPTAGAQSMTDTLRELVQLLSQDLSIADVSAHVGTIVNDPGVPQPIELKPAIAGVRAAGLSRYPETGKPYLLTLELAPKARPTVAEMRGQFGDYRRAWTDIGRPVQLLFSPPAAEHWSIVLIADLEPGPLPVQDSNRVATVSLRRDPRTP
jgi:hypothetical protein